VGRPTLPSQADAAPPKIPVKKRPEDGIASPEVTASHVNAGDEHPYGETTNSRNADADDGNDTTPEGVTQDDVALDEDDSTVHCDNECFQQDETNEAVTGDLKECEKPPTPLRFGQKPHDVHSSVDEPRRGSLDGALIAENGARDSIFEHLEENTSSTGPRVYESAEAIPTTVASPRNEQDCAADDDEGGCRKRRRIQNATGTSAEFIANLRDSSLENVSALHNSVPLESLSTPHTTLESGAKTVTLPPLTVDSREAAGNVDEGCFTSVRSPNNPPCNTPAEEPVATGTIEVTSAVQGVNISDSNQPRDQTSLISDTYAVALPRHLSAGLVEDSPRQDPSLPCTVGAYEVKPDDLNRVAVVREGKDICLFGGSSQSSQPKSRHRKPRSIPKAKRKSAGTKRKNQPRGTKIPIPVSSGDDEQGDGSSAPERVDEVESSDNVRPAPAEPSVCLRDELIPGPASCDHPIRLLAAAEVTESPSPLTPSPNKGVKQHGHAFAAPLPPTSFDVCDLLKSADGDESGKLAERSACPDFDATTAITAPVGRATPRLTKMKGDPVFPDSTGDLQSPLVVEPEHHEDLQRFVEDLEAASSSFSSELDFSLRIEPSKHMERTPAEGEACSDAESQSDALLATSTVDDQSTRPTRVRAMKGRVTGGSRPPQKAKPENPRAGRGFHRAPRRKGVTRRTSARSSKPKPESDIEPEIEQTEFSHHHDPYSFESEPEPQPKPGDVYAFDLLDQDSTTTKTSMKRADRLKAPESRTASLGPTTSKSRRRKFEDADDLVASEGPPSKRSKTQDTATLSAATSCSKAPSKKRSG
jgi:hypothetical protein